MELTIRAARIGESRRHRLQKLLVIAGLFCLVYNPPLIKVSVMHLVGLLSIVYLLIRFGRTAAMIRSLRIGGVVLGVILWLCYLIWAVVLLNAEDWMFTIVPLYFLVDVVPFGMALRILFEDNGWSSDDFIDMVVVTAVIHALLALAAFLSSDIQSFFVSKFLDYGYDDVIVGMSAHRFYGFASWLSFDMPIMQTILALLVIHPSRKAKLSNYIIATLLFFSAIINARNAIVIAVIGFFTMIVLDRWPLRKRLRYAVALTVFIVAALAILLPAIRSLAPWTYRWIATGFGEILEFLFGGSEGVASSSYFDYILTPDIYRFPEGLTGVLFGAGHPTMGMGERYGYSSDIGYTNDIWLGGIVYMVLLYLFFAALMLALRKHPNPRISFLGTFLLISYPFINIKGNAASTNEFSYFLFLVYLVAAGEHRTGTGRTCISSQSHDGSGGR